MLALNKKGLKVSSAVFFVILAVGFLIYLNFFQPESKIQNLIGGAQTSNINVNN